MYPSVSREIEWQWGEYGTTTNPKTSKRRDKTWGDRKGYYRPFLHRVSQKKKRGKGAQEGKGSSMKQGQTKMKKIGWKGSSRRGGWGANRGGERKFFQRYLHRLMGTRKKDSDQAFGVPSEPGWEL